MGVMVMMWYVCVPCTHSHHIINVASFSYEKTSTYLLNIVMTGKNRNEPLFVYILFCILLHGDLREERGTSKKKITSQSIQHYHRHHHHSGSPIIFVSLLHSLICPACEQCLAWIYFTVYACFPHTHTNSVMLLYSLSIYPSISPFFFNSLDNVAKKM